MGSVEWVVIGFVIFVLVLITIVYFVAKWLYKEEKQNGN